MTDIDYGYDERELTHDDCLGFHPDSPCEGKVDLYPPSYSEWLTQAFPRCEKHYDEYLTNCEKRDEREREYEASLYCVHGTFIGDAFGPDYLCSLCEAW